MKKRMKMRRSASKKYFTKHAKKINRRNIAPTNPMRGGLRM